HIAGHRVEPAVLLKMDARRRRRAAPKGDAQLLQYLRPCPAGIERVRPLIKEIAVALARAGATTGTPPFLQHSDLPAGPREIRGGAQPGQASADDDSVVLFVISVQHRIISLCRGLPSSLPLRRDSRPFCDKLIDRLPRPC